MTVATPTAFLQVVGRHFNGYPVARQRLDPVLFHLAGGVGDDLVTGIELHAVARIGEDFGDQSFELDQLFFSHGYLQIDWLLAWPLSAIGAGVRAAFAVQESNALDAFSPQAFRFGAAMRRTDRFLPVGLVRVGLQMTILT